MHFLMAALSPKQTSFRVPSRLTAAQRPGHRQPLPWAGDMVRRGTRFLVWTDLATIKRCLMSVGSPPQGLTLASCRQVEANGSNVPQSSH